MTATFSKSVVEKKAKELEPGLNIKTQSASLKRYLARYKACQELHKGEAGPVIIEMITKLYKAVPPSRSWIEELNMAGEQEAAKSLVGVLGEPKAAPPKPEKKSKGPAGPADPAKTGAPGQPANQAPPPPAPPAASASLDALLGVK